MRNRSPCSIWLASTFVLFAFLTKVCDAGTLNSIGAVSTAAAAAAQAASQIIAEAGTNNNNTIDSPLATENAGISDDNGAFVSALPQQNSTAAGDKIDTILDNTANGREGENTSLADNSTLSSYTTAAVQGLPASVVAEASNQNDNDDKGDGKGGGDDDNDDENNDDKDGKSDKKKGGKKKNTDDTAGVDTNNKNVDRPPEQAQEEVEDMILEDEPYPYLVSRDEDTRLCAYEVAGILTCIQWDSFCTGECDFNSYQNGSGCHVTQRMPSNSEDDVEPAGCGCDETKMCKCHHPLHDIEYHIGRECHSHMRVDSGEQTVIFPGILNVDEEEESGNQSGGSGRRKLARMENGEQRTRRSNNLRRRYD